MKKIIILAAFALVAGTTAIVTVHPQQAVACDTSNC
jgi:hypothetical protein